MASHRKGHTPEKEEVFSIRKKEGRIEKKEGDGGREKTEKEARREREKRKINVNEGIVEI